MKRKFFATLLAGACLLVAAGCGKAEPDPTPTPSDPSVTDPTPYSEDASIENVEWVGYVTGQEATTDTLAGWQVGGADLGFPIYNRENGNMYVAFGDTFQMPSSQSGLWRSNVVGVTQDFTLSDGLSFDSFIGNGVIAQAVFEGQHIDGYEITRIPTGGVELGGVMYYFYFSKLTWNYTTEIPVGKSMNYGGCVKSEDGGQTWQRVHDLSWLDPSVPANKEQIERLANQNIDLTDGDFGITMENHSGFSFTQIFPLDGKDGYVYLFGEGGYRTGGIRLARVAYADFEQFEEYEYFNGTDAEGQPIWLKGHEGLLEAEKNKANYICDGRCSEQSAMYNEYLNKWMVVYMLPGTGIVYRTADNVYGPYTKPMTIMKADFPFPNGLQSLYAGIVHEKWTEENGKVFYLIVSQWKPVYNSSLMKVTIKETV